MVNHANVKPHAAKAVMIFVSNMLKCGDRVKDVLGRSSTSIVRSLAANQDLAVLRK